MKNIRFSILACTFILACMTVGAQPAGERRALREDFPVAVPSSPDVRYLTLNPRERNGALQDVTVERDIVYSRPGGMALHLTVLRPSGARRSLPCVIFIPGSAWKRQNLQAPEQNMIRFASRGYVVAVMEYRPSSVARFPAQVQDAVEAVKFLRSSAGKYGVDQDNIFIWGSSSGGHTALLAGLYSTEPEARVGAVVDFFGPADLVAMPSQPSHMDHGAADSPEGLLLGKAIGADSLLARKASPVSYVTANAVPVFIAHGDSDATVPFGQSDGLALKYASCGARFEFYCLQGAGHGSPHFWTETVLDLVDGFLKSCTE